VNFAENSQCRKCGSEFEKTEPPKETPAETKVLRTDAVLQNDAAILKAVESGKTVVISGEAAPVLKSAAEQLQQYSMVYGKCTGLTQLTPGGVIQDILLSLFGLANFCIYNAQFKKDAFKFLHHEFPELSGSEVSDLVNFLYPVNEGIFEEIFINKNYTFEILKKVFAKMGEFIFVIDNFDYIDAFSYEFLLSYKGEYTHLQIEPVKEPLPDMEALSQIQRDVLAAAAVMGDKINFTLISGILDIENIEDIAGYLEKSGFIIPGVFYEFKSLAMREAVLETVRCDSNFEEINRKIYSFLINFTLSSNTVLGIAAQNMKDIQTAFEVWTKNTRLCAYIGDTGLYSIMQKQCLALINEFDEASNIRFSIAERLGKLLSASNPKEAMDYLPDAIANAAGNKAKEIELLAYMSSCCRAAGNYYGEIECVDTVLAKIEPERALNTALLKTAKLQALFNIGNCGEIINLIDNEIMPVFNEYFGKKHAEAFVFETWTKTYLLLANTLILQGNKRAFEVLDIVKDIIERYKIEDLSFLCRYKTALACAHTMQGDLPQSDEILKQLNVPDDLSEAILLRNLAVIINRLITRQYEGLQEEMHSVVMYANNIGNNPIKNIIKVLLGKILQDKGQIQDAMKIYNKQAEYFAKEKNTTGALLSWYLIAKADPENAAEVALKALEAAQDPKIDNMFFANLFNKILLVVADN
jgi:tetratricopeptide (TPR) repeat protein